MHFNDWAKALDEFWGHPQIGARAILMLESMSLLSVAELAEKAFPSFEEAETDFLHAVRTYLDGKRARPWHPEPLSPNIPPRFLLQIAVQVYAASKMADDPEENFTETAYYPQLERLIGDLGAKERFNQNDQGEYHQLLWRERLPEWAKQKNLTIELPEDRSGAGRHVRLPKSQAVLRIGDLVRLPMFFRRSGLKPFDSDTNNPSDDDQLAFVVPYLRRWSNDEQLFSRWAREVLNDEQKFPIAVAQVQETLRQWDGRLHIKDAGRRKAHHDQKDYLLWIDIHRRRRTARILSGESKIAAKLITNDEFFERIRNKSERIDRIGLRDGLFVLRYEEGDGWFKQTDFLEPGDRGLIVAAPNAFHSLKRLLDEDVVCKTAALYSSLEQDDSEVLEGIPEGCSFADLRIADPLPAITDISEHWRQFLRSPRARLWLGGGLRIDRKERWVAGAGPYLKISGNSIPPFINVDGRRVEITSRIVRSDLFSIEGPHEIVATIDGHHFPPKQFTVEIPRSEVSTDFPCKHWRFNHRQWPTFHSPVSEETGQLNEARLFGVRGVGFAYQSKVINPTNLDDRRVAIRILAGLPLIEPNQSCSTHPVVHQLLRRRERLRMQRGVST